MNTEAKAYDVNQKQVAKATMTMRKDFANFGTFSTSEIAKVAAEAQKLNFVSLNEALPHSAHPRLPSECVWCVSAAGLADASGGAVVEIRRMIQT